VSRAYQIAGDPPTHVSKADKPDLHTTLRIQSVSLARAVHLPGAWLPFPAVVHMSTGGSPVGSGAE
jgi:hypothetical protein